VVAVEAVVGGAPPIVKLLAGVLDATSVETDNGKERKRESRKK